MYEDDEFTRNERNDNLKTKEKTAQWVVNLIFSVLKCLTLCSSFQQILLEGLKTRITESNTLRRSMLKQLSSRIYL